MRSKRPLRSRQFAWLRVAGVHGSLRLDQEELDFFAGARAVLDAARHDEELGPAREQRNWRTVMALAETAMPSDGR